MPTVRVLGTFEIRSADGTLTRWQSRKARKLVKILIAKRGTAISRESLMHLLWPDKSPRELANRFSVAATTVRRALDPTRAFPHDTYLEVRDALVRLRIDRIDIDVERFLVEARTALLEPAPIGAAIAQMKRALDLYSGDPLVDDDADLWAQELRHEVHVAFLSLSHTLAEASKGIGDQLTRVDCYRRILIVENYDCRAHEGLIDALTLLGATGQVATARATYAQRMTELERQS